MKKKSNKRREVQKLVLQCKSRGEKRKKDSCSSGVQEKYVFRVKASMEIKPMIFHSLPKIGDILLINEKDVPNWARVHGGRHAKESTRRYFARVADIFPYVIVMDTCNGYLVSESIRDIRLGLVQYIRLKEMPENAGSISYEERLLSTFVGAFEELLVN